MLPCHGRGRGFESRPVRTKGSEYSEPFFMPIHYVYILKSLKDGTYYKGYSTDYTQRLHEHNYGRTNYTCDKRPWDLIYVEVQPSKKAALLRERKLKHCKCEYYEWLKMQPSNILNK
jgi:putative endonuclease